MTEDAHYRQRWPLHALGSSFARGIRDDDDAWLQEWKRLLRMHPATEPDAAGQLPFDCLQQTDEREWQHAGQAAELLVVHGFNPLERREGRGACPLVANFFGAQTGSVFEGIGLGLMHGLARREAKQPMRTEQGGNALHAFVAWGAELLPWVLEYHDPEPGRASLCLPAVWFDAPDDDGMRPLELIWAPGHLWDKTMGVADLSQRELDMACLLEATDALVKGGADPLRDRGQAQRMLDALVCANGAQHTWAMGVPGGVALAARIEQGLLERGTSIVNRPGGGKIRL